MNLEMDSGLASQYKSASQMARVVSEGWIEKEMYCPACASPSLTRLGSGQKVIDFRCPECEEAFQAKSMSKPFGRKVMDSAYGTMMKAITEESAPNLILMSYSRDYWSVRDLLLVPRHLLTPSVIERRNPLKSSARRAGWIGCNIVLDLIPDDGRVHAVLNSSARRPSAVRWDWKQVEFLKRIDSSRRGWLLDVWRCIERLGKGRFTLKELYRFEADLAALHPGNAHVRPKIRQQLQFLRDEGKLSFEQPGEYLIL